MNWKLALGACALGLAAWVLAPSSASAAENDYLCHQVKDLKTPAKFVPLSGQNRVDQIDQFACDVKKPFLLCNPTGLTPPDPTLHYCCYLAKCTPKKLTSTFQITDQWGTLGLGAKKAKYICNQCVKEDTTP